MEHKMHELFAHKTHPHLWEYLLAILMDLTTSRKVINYAAAQDIPSKLCN
jgi:hypothetical protein